jgi:hypothetical protein
VGKNALIFKFARKWLPFLWKTLILGLLLVACNKQAMQGQSVGSIEGDVSDPTHASIDGATVMAQDAASRTVCDVKTDAAGHFACPPLPLGIYRVTVSARGFSTDTRTSVQTTAANPSAQLAFTLTLSAESTSVTVSATQHEIATEQIHAAEKQRILGIVPNFYTSFDPHAAPLSTGQKYSLAIRDLVDPVTFLSAGATAGLEQAHNSYKGYGQGAAGYAKRFGAAYADGLSSDLFRHAIFASLFHQDPRYFYQGTGSFKSRFVHAISFSVALRGDDGSLKPNYSYLAGYLASGALSNAYYPEANRGAGLVFTRALIGIAGTAGQGVLREFVWSHVTTNRRKP